VKCMRVSKVLMSRFLFAPFVLALLLVASPAYAVQFTLESYSIDLRDHDPGLVLYSKNLYTKPIDFALNYVGHSETIKDLFEIGTYEGALNFEDDLKKYDIEASFKFSAPAPAFDGEAGGYTGASWFIKSFGYVDWSNPFEVKFGTNGLLGITLEDVKFGLPGSAKVDATFTLLRKDSGSPTSVPEPASAALLGIGAIAMGVVRRRRPTTR
jgi:hypothetical protein